MKFKITRTSDHENCPCPEAYRDDYVQVDRRTADAPEKIPARVGQGADWWYEIGRNHRVENGRIARDFDAKGWFIDVDSLDDLLELLNKYGQLVIQWCWYNDEIIEIEIYDSYRE